MKKGIYIDNTPLSEALRIWDERLSLAGLAPLEGESVPAHEALGRTTAEAVTAKISSPFFHSAAMDGFAVRYLDTFGASETTPKALEIGSRAMPINTGDPLPDGFDAVIMIEDTNTAAAENGDCIEIIEPAVPWQHVRLVGEDIVGTELILPENHAIRPQDIGAVLAGGHTEIKVRRRPKVAVIPTGSEIVEPGTELKKGDIIEYNSRMLSGLIRQWGGIPLRMKPVKDDLELIKQAISEACENSDLVVVNAGSSAGSKDFTAQAISGFGEVVLHGVDIKPGKPVILGFVKGKPVLGIPGYPVSTYITFNLFAKPLIHKLLGVEPPEPRRIKAMLSRQVSSSLGQEEFLRVKVGRVGDRLIATPVGRGAGVLMSLVRADGFLRIPSFSEGCGAGTEVDVELLRDERVIENTVVCIGSHDNALDVLANVLKKKHPSFSLSSAHVGSMGGLVALKRGEAHMAGTHMLDEASGEYNVPYIKRILGDKKIVLINLVYRMQGLMVAKSNPKRITGFADLLRDDVSFINRQAGSGTRLLTDKYLRDLGIQSSLVRGYDREEFTHMSVASAVLSGTADAGMGILAAAEALGLDFIPLAKERYDIAFQAEFIEAPAVSAIIGIIKNSVEFREMVLRLGGYDVSDMGKVMYES